MTTGAVQFAAPESRPATLAASIERLLPLTKWSSMRTGAPPADDGERWLAYERFTEAAPIRELVQRRAAGEDYAGVDELIVGNYIFRDAVGTPLGLIGYLWAREYRVPRLAGNAFAQDAGWLQNWTWTEPAAFVLPGDPLEGAAGIETLAAGDSPLEALDAAMFDEVHRFIDPILAAFRELRYVAPANGWGSILDAIMYGAELAASSDEKLGRDRAWERWNAAVAGRTFAVRRRPRRMRYEWEAGQWDETIVRAGCCLWYMTPEAKSGEDGQDYCTSCYLKTDEKRTASLIDWKRQVAAGTAVEH